MKNLWLQASAAVLTDPNIGDLFQSVPLYDMGTIGIPERILLKPSRLMAAEFDIMKTHTTLARDAIEQAEKTLDHRTEQLLKTLKELAYSHQEKWDGFWRTTPRPDCLRLPPSPSIRAQFA